jgi:hypothetical protein
MTGSRAGNTGVLAGEDTGSGAAGNRRPADEKPRELGELHRENRHKRAGKCGFGELTADISRGFSRFPGVFIDKRRGNT